MARAEAALPAEGARILVALDVLMVEDPARPRPSHEASVALDRLALVGQPVVLVGREIAGRRLPADPETRIAWVRQALGAPDLAVASFDEPGAGRAGADADEGAADQWLALRHDFSADRLLTRRASSVGPARRAGLEVFRIGPRDATTLAAVERPDHEARDLLDAVNLLVAAAAFQH